MKIINTNIENDVLTITLDSASSITKVYLDSVLNSKNMYSDKDSDHDYVVTNFIVSGNNIVVDITEYEATSFIVSVLTLSSRSESIAIDLYNLYQAKVNMLTSYCSTCLDKHQKEMIVMCDFRSQLLNYALENGLTNDAIEHYIALSRMLNIADKYDCAKCSSKCIKCKTCQNGVCML